MKHRFAVLTLALSILPLAGCVSGPSPQYVAGRYYMAGDTNCYRWQVAQGTDLSCWDKQGSFTGYREPMPQDQAQAYLLETQLRNAQQAQLIQQNAMQMQAIGQQALQQSQSWSAPTVQGIPNPAGATGYNQVGNTIIGTDGTSCQTVGQTTVCR